MLRYMALAWNADDPDACHTAMALQNSLCSNDTVWSCGIMRKGLSIHYTGASERCPDIIPLPDNAGMILGTLYPSQPQSSPDLLSRPPSLDAVCLARIRSSAGRSMIQEFWGSYVLIQTDSPEPCIRILRGPMSDLPCFYTHYRGVYLFFAFLQDCLDLGVGPFSLNTSYVRAIVVFGDPRTHETGLNEVFSIDVGECVMLRPDRLIREWYWHPGHIASSNTIHSVAEAVGELRAATQWCVHASAARHDSIVLLLSGGNDSSIVAACLKDAPTKPLVTCLTHRFSGAIGDETRFARAAAGQCNFDLVEMSQRSDVDLEVMRSVARLPRPRVYYSGYHAYRDIVQSAESYRATAILSGSMGDCVFGRLTPLMAPAEYIQRHGIRPKLLRIAYDIGVRERLSIWRVLRSAIQIGLLNRPHGQWSLYQHEKTRSSFRSYMHDRMLTQDAISQFERDLPRFVHTWLQQAEDLPIGKLAMIAILTKEMGCDIPFVNPTDPPIVRPLAAQPLVECSLRIESFLNFVGGWDRAIARLAFADNLPKEILRRNSKGSPLRTMRQVIDGNALFIREFLLDGILVNERILDRKLIDAALPATPTKAPASALRLMEHLYTEAWLRHWVSDESRLAA